MAKMNWAVAACTTVLCAATALAAPGAQQKCDGARITAWKRYVSCVDAVVAKDAKGARVIEFAAFAKCRHKYFGRWTAFQSYTGSTCAGARFTDNHDRTVTDNLTGLVWEQKDSLDSTANGSDPHDADNLYTWSTVSIEEDGTAFTSFLTALNAGTGFGGSNGWRLPTLAELQSIVLDFACGPVTACGCPSVPCIDSALDASDTQHDVTYGYYSATSAVPDPSLAWRVEFGEVRVDHVVPKQGLGAYVRAVRGGL